MGARRWSRPAPTSPTAWSGSRRTPRSRWWCARRATACARYSHIGTGNYNADTAELYTDLGLFTCDPDDRRRRRPSCSTCLTGYLDGPELPKLLVAPVNMRPRFLERDRSARSSTPRPGRGGRIIAKMNALEDAEIIHALYEASQAGVEIDLHRARHLPPAPGPAGRERERSASSRSSAASSSTPGSSASATAASPSTSSARRTGCRATSIAGSRRWCRSTRRRCGASCRRSSTSSSPTTATPGSSGRTARGGASSRLRASPSAPASES